jgi:curved DNA-binding protein CbpA
MPTFYETLKIPPHATATQIKSAFRALAKQYHPDCNPHSLIAKDQFSEINAAYIVLGNVQKRTAYDLEISAQKTEKKPFFRDLEGIFKAKVPFETPKKKATLFRAHPKASWKKGDIWCQTSEVSPPPIFCAD